MTRFGARRGGAWPLRSDAVAKRFAQLGGDFQLTWRKATPNVVETPIVLESVGSILTRFSGHAITSEATLSVRGLDAAFDRFVVRKPEQED